VLIFSIRHPGEETRGSKRLTCTLQAADFRSVIGFLLLPLAPLWNSQLVRVVAAQFTPTGALPAGEPRLALRKPNVRAKPDPTVGRQAQATENVHRTRGLGLVARRWGSA
jgi:hypothetical protein